MSEDVKPCPYCGVMPEQYRDRQFEDWVIYCGNDDCPVTVDVRDSDSAQAITAWNTRTGEHAAYERGKAEGREAERGRIVEALEELKQWHESQAKRFENRDYNYSRTATASSHAYTTAINIVNQK